MFLRELPRLQAEIAEDAGVAADGTFTQAAIGFAKKLGAGPDGLKVVETSRQDVLDTLVLDKLKTLKLVVPPANTSQQDRTFEINYEFR